MWRFDWLFRCLVLGWLVGCCQDPQLSQSECERVRDHVVDVALSHVSDASTERMKAELARHRTTLRATLGDAFTRECEEGGQTFVDCMLATKSSGDIANCAERTAQ